MNLSTNSLVISSLKKNTLGLGKNNIRLLSNLLVLSGVSNGYSSLNLELIRSIVGNLHSPWTRLELKSAFVWAKSTILVTNVSSVDGTHGTLPKFNLSIQRTSVTLKSKLTTLGSLGHLPGTEGASSLDSLHRNVVHIGKGHGSVLLEDIECSINFVALRSRPGSGGNEEGGYEKSDLHVDRVCCRLWFCENVGWVCWVDVRIC
mmetsp:Transcript_7417/g.9566  ORF Transcript_7417/g.9566 Transcript_7417/m.9566 type:complete len:204 (-) Transcript_7417:1353-1964(-)